jgi:nucleotide-binding universal stress UspA family protein
MFRTLMVALDGTPFGEHALPYAVGIARRTGAVLVLAHVHVPTLDLGVENPWRAENRGESAADERAYLTKQECRVKAHAPEVAVRSSLIDGTEADSIAGAIAAHAEKLDVGLIVLNSHARGGLARLWSGNIAEELLRHTLLPVLVTPSLDEDPDWNELPEFRHILVALDGTPTAEQVLPVALTLGGSMGAEYTLLRVVEPVSVPVVDPVCAPAVAFDTTLIERQEADAEAYLKRVAARLRGDEAKLKLRRRVLLDTTPAEGISAFLASHVPHGAAPADGELAVDLAVLATHGRGGLARLLMGSVADRVLQHSPVPLLLQRPVAPDAS